MELGGTYKRFYDTQSKVLLDYDVAAERVAAGHDAIVDLREVLMAREFPLDPNLFKDARDAKRTETAGWDTERYREYGKWVAWLVETPDGQPRPVTQYHLERMYTMGLGPYGRTMLGRLALSGMLEFRKFIGGSIGYVRGYYANWDAEKYAKYARRVEKTANGRRPSEKDYNAAAARGWGPTVRAIQLSRFGSISAVNELIWYPDVPNMDEDDVVFWGARVMLANEGKLSSKMVQILGARHRGPGRGGVLNKFETWDSFIKRSREQYEFDIAQAEASRNRKLARYNAMIDAGIMSPDFALLSDETFFEVAGRFVVVHHCVPDISPIRKHTIACGTSGSLKSELKKSRPQLTDGFIESAALMLEVSDDVWPLDDGLQHLRVTEAEWEVVRRQYRARKRNRRKNK